MSKLVRGRSKKEGRHIRVYHWVLETAAWRSLDGNAKALYLKLLERYGGPGSNNGRIGLSVRDAADDLHVSKSTAARTFVELQHKGLIAIGRRGRFDRKVRHASEWRLTEFPCDVTGELATKDFVRWAPENLKPVPLVGQPVPLVGQSVPLMGPKRLERRQSVPLARP